MIMKWILVIITLLGVLTGVYTFLKTDKFKGICQVILAVVSPVITMLFVSLKESRAFGGTDWEFLVHSATIDGSILPWLNLILYAIEVVFIVRTIFIISKKKEG